MATLVWGERHGRWRRIVRGVYGVGPQDPTPLDIARARVLRVDGVASGNLAGVLHGLDSVELDDRPLRRRQLPAERIVIAHGIRCTDGLQTLLDLAATMTDITWEHALESALRKKLTTVADLEEVLDEPRVRNHGASRMRRVLALRPPGAAPTGSLLETLMVQLIRKVDSVPEPARQVDVENRYGEFVARVDLAWPDIGLFLELDGDQHKGQPVYDATRETAIIAAKGWLCGRFTWGDVNYRQRVTARRLGDVVAQARARPFSRSVAL